MCEKSFIWYFYGLSKLGEMNGRRSFGSDFGGQYGAINRKNHSYDGCGRNSFDAGGGTVLFPFLAASAGGAAAATGATNASVLGSFWAPLFTNTSGEVGLTAGLGKMVDGLGALFNSAVDVGSAAFDPSRTFKEALFSPAP